MLLLASSVGGLFKRRQFEPKVMLLAVGRSASGACAPILTGADDSTNTVTVWRWIQHYGPEMTELKAHGVLDENSKHRPRQYLNNILEQDHHQTPGAPQANIFVRSGELGGTIAVAVYEAIHMIRKGQACFSVGLLHHFILGLFAATN